MRVLVPPHLLTGADFASRLAFLARLPGGVKLTFTGERWVAEAADRGSWGGVLDQALHGLLQELTVSEREAG